MDAIIPLDFNPDAQQQPRLRWLGKAFLAAAAIITAALFITYLIPGNSLLSYLEGRAASSTIDENFAVATKGGSSVVFSEGVYRQLLDIYEAEQEHEFKACLEGRKEGNRYIITAISQPRVYSQTVFSVAAAECSDNTIIQLHSHPFRSCVPSQQDLASQAAFKQANPDSIGAVMCEKNRFAFY